MGLNGELNKVKRELLDTEDIELAMTEFININTEVLLPHYMYSEDFDIDAETSSYIKSCEQLNHWILKHGLQHFVIKDILIERAKEVATIYQSLKNYFLANNAI